MQKVTMNHDDIKKWVESHNGKPAIINHPEAKGDHEGIRINFPGSADEALLSKTKDISWDEFFQIFDNEQLQLEYEENPKEADVTSWYRFLNREG